MYRFSSVSIRKRRMANFRPGISVQATVLISSTRYGGEGSRDICNSTEPGNVISVFGAGSNGHLLALLPSLHFKLFIEMDKRDKHFHPANYPRRGYRGLESRIRSLVKASPLIRIVRTRRLYSIEGVKILILFSRNCFTLHLNILGIFL